MKRIGIIDSGVGGLSIWREIVTHLPSESTTYIADQKYCPYGERSPEEIYQLSRRLISYLLKQNVKLIVLACNTITVSCLDRLRKEFLHIPIVGTVPVIKVAAALSKTKRIGILSTVRTAESDYQKKLISDFAGDCVVLNEGTNELVPLVEGAELESEKAMKIITSVLTSFQRRNVDVLALGCTHYPFLKDRMQNILGDTVVILDSGEAIARQVARILEATNAMAVGVKGEHAFVTTGDAVTFRTVAKKLLGDTMTEEITVEGITL